MALQDTDYNKIRTRLLSVGRTFFYRSGDSTAARRTKNYGGNFGQTRLFFCLQNCLLLNNLVTVALDSKINI